MTSALAEWEAYKAKHTDKDDLIAFAEGKLAEARSHAKELGRLSSRITFAIIVGQVWFTEFSSLDENSMEVEYGGAKYLCTAELVETKVNI